MRADAAGSSGTETLLGEAADWDLFDVNVRVGPSGVHGELALEKPGLLEEMDRFFIRRALVSHWAGEEYDPSVGNDALAREADERLVPAWAVLPDVELLEALAARKPKAVRITPGPTQH